MDFLNYLLAFIEGLALITSPCILPILPILLTGSIIGNKRKPLGVIIGFAFVFSLITLFSHFLVQKLHIDLNLLRDIAFLLIIIFGCLLVSDYLTEKFSFWTSKIANSATQLEQQTTNKEGFISGFILGSLVSLIWTPCAGPILAAAIVQIAVQKTTLNSFFALFFFALGSVLPMIIIAIAGKKLLAKITILKTHSKGLRKISGYLIIFFASSLLLITHYSPDFFARLANSKTPQSLTRTGINDQGLASALVNPYPAPQISDISAWINSAPLNLSALKNKVVLLDFWTYSCINCIRTLPYLIAWDKAYRDQGLVIIGIHTPEFEFEKSFSNVKNAVQRSAIQYPVALDNQYSTWLNYHNQYWPAHYLIDQNGNVVYQHFGEGDYGITEHNIRQLLGITQQKNLTAAKESPTVTTEQSPETYLGSARMSNFVSPEPVRKQISYYSIPLSLPINSWALQGKWLIQADKIISASSPATIALHFHSAHVYAVMGANKPSMITVLYNGQPLTSNAGKDVKNSTIEVQEQRLYEIADFPQATSGEIRLVIPNPGVELYTFTFG